MVYKQEGAIRSKLGYAYLVTATTPSGLPLGDDVAQTQAAAASRKRGEKKHVHINDSKADLPSSPIRAHEGEPTTPTLFIQNTRRQKESQTSCKPNVSYGYMAEPDNNHRSSHQSHRRHQSKHHFFTKMDRGHRSKSMCADMRTLCAGKSQNNDLKTPAGDRSCKAITPRWAQIEEKVLSRISVSEFPCNHQLPEATVSKRKLLHLIVACNSSHPSVHVRLMRLMPSAIIFYTYVSAPQHPNRSKSGTRALNKTHCLSTLLFLAS